MPRVRRFRERADSFRNQFRRIYSLDNPVTGCIFVIQVTYSIISRISIRTKYIIRTKYAGIHASFLTYAQVLRVIT